MLSLHVEWISDRGGRDYNEDACGHWRSERHLCAVLADGAGGHGGGDIASRLAVRELVGRLAQRPTERAQELADGLRAVNDAMIQARRPGTVQQDMYSTVVGLVIDLVDGRVHWGHVGDSRLYWFRRGRLLQRTRDHSMVQSLVDAGMLKAERISDHPQRSELRSALGVPSDVLELAAADGEQAVQPGDVFLLCTDGLWEYTDDALLEQLLAQAGNARDWLESLRTAVGQATGLKAQHDNFTALTVWVDDDPAAGPAH